MSALAIIFASVALLSFVVSYFIKSPGYSFLFATISFVFTCLATGPVGYGILGGWVAGLIIFAVGSYFSAH